MVTPSRTHHTGRTRRRGLSVLVALSTLVGGGLLLPGAASAHPAHPGHPAPASAHGWRQLAPGAAPRANPLEGFIPYAGDYSTFPYAMEWFYLPLNAVMTGPDTFDWGALDTQLDTIAARGHQAAFRFYLDYPGKPSGVPRYLLDGGLVTHPYQDFGNNGVSVSPDYDDPALDSALDRFIAALGARYDGDPRIGFLQLGLLGFWGEWHTYPHDGTTLPEDWFASPAEQRRILHDFDAAFDTTRLQARYPSTDNAALDMGYHDDSFAVETLPGTGWHFMDKAIAAGTTDKWRTEPVGGELRPEIQGCIFDATPDCPVVEDGADNDFAGSVAATHASWLLDQYAFAPGHTGADRDRALAGAQSLGYRLRVTAARTQAGGRTLAVGVRMENTGVAPFSYDWPVQIAAVDRRGRIARTWTTPWKLTAIEPGEPQRLTASLGASGLRPGTYTLVMRAANPLPNGVPLRFANADQDSTVNGWLTLGTTRVR
ncbi:DUF4832 domain-containing protein [Actinacidiphila alni]|uniref:DUF4832 domain-containing protein n=1 Tax=Actinacidiphila alni TaxID=380248 RepID=UPI003409C0CF